MTQKIMSLIENHSKLIKSLRNTPTHTIDKRINKFLNLIANELQDGFTFFNQWLET